MVHMLKGMCHEWTIARMLSHEPLLAEVSWYNERMRSHDVRQVPDLCGDLLSVTCRTRAEACHQAKKERHHVRRRQQSDCPSLLGGTLEHGQPCQHRGDF